ncbi:MAG: hypothetical protein JJT94_04150 [Bernardetiaceae bacterium]|nr:hypothetical protein [Bernardetiaceae bacterium]
MDTTSEMIVHQAVQDLYNNYSQHQPADLPPVFFETLLTFYPALAVVACDNVVDEAEQEYIAYMANFMARSHKDELPENLTQEELEAHFNDNMLFLAHNNKTWEKPFLQALSDYLQKHEDYKEIIYDVLEMFAESSDGMSKVEKKKIKEINALLHLID